MVLPLAVIMVVLISVMGAGLLVFANTDLKTVVEVNQGQRAFDAADSGIHAARRQLLSDADPDHYDSNGAGNTSWAYKSTSGGDQQKMLAFDGRIIRVSIQYLPPVSEGTTPNSGQAPEVIPAGQSKLQSGCNYFKVKSYGESGQATRGAEAIYCASKLDVPTSYYTPKNIEFAGNVHISGVSFFSGGNIEGSRSGSVTIDRSASALYGDWDTTKYNPPSNHNTTARTRTVSGVTTPVMASGLAAEGRICGNAACTVSVSDSYYGTYDYDGFSGTKFCRKPAPTGSSAPCSTTVAVSDPNPANTISYPFKPDFDPDLEFLKEEAKGQGNHYPTRTDIDNSTVGGNAKYPEGSSDQTVFYVNGQGGDVSYNVPDDYGCTGCLAKGTIIVENGNLNMSGGDVFKGIIIITGNGTTTGLYKSTGSPELDGFVLADGKMTIRGDVGALTVTDAWTNRPGFYGVKLWSWRECYNTTCS